MHIALLCFNTYPVICSGVLREHALRYSLIFSRMLVVATYILCKCFCFVSFFLLSASCVVSLVCFAIFACWNNGEKKYSLKENYKHELVLLCRLIYHTSIVFRLPFRSHILFGDLLYNVRIYLLLRHQSPTCTI